MKKLFYLCIFLLILFSILVVADGLGDSGTAYITNVNSSLTILSTVDGTTNLVVTGTTRATERALVFITINSVRYALGEVNTSFRDASNGTSNASFRNLIQAIDLDQKKAIFDIKLASRGSGILTMYILKNTTDNALVLCEGATISGNVGHGCVDAVEVTKERIIYPNGDTGGYTVTSYTDSTTGLDYWKVYGVTGTGIQSVFVDLGSGDVSKIATKEKFVSLDEESSKKYVSNLNVEYYVEFKGKKYLFVVKEIDSQNKYASVFVEALGESFSVSKGDSKDFDLDGDGETDVVFTVVKLEYPFIYAELSVYEPVEEITFVAKEKVAEDARDPILEYSGGIWSRFLKTVETSKTTFLLVVLSVLIIVVAFTYIGKKVLGKIWKAT